MSKYTLTLFLCLIGSVVISQSVNDYRTIGSGNWTNISIWEIYNGTAWVAAINYPGQVVGTNDVSIIGNVTVTLNSNIPNNFNSLTIGDSNGTPDYLDIAGTSSLNTLNIAMQSDGFMRWTANVTFSIPAGGAITIESGGGLLASGPCNGSKRIDIGTARYSACNGQAGTGISFEDINNAGGSISVTPTSNAPICVGLTLNLLAGASGFTNPSQPTTFSWVGTGSGGYTFNSTIENPTIIGLIAGTYTYTVTISNDGNSNTNSVDVIVIASPNPPTSNGNQIGCIGGTIPALTASVNTGETIDWYDAVSGGTLLLANSTSYTPTISGSYYAETRNTIAGCLSTTRTEVILTTQSCRLITNRRITYRVSPGNTLSGTPTGTLTNDLTVSFFADGQFGPGNPYQLQVQNTTAIPFSYEIYIVNVPYASIPGLNLGNHTVNITNNGNNTYNYLFSSTVQLGAFQTTQILGSGGAPSPPGTGTACSCITFYKL